MTTLNLLLSDPQKRSRLVGDCAALVDSEVRGKTGLSGMAVKTAYAVVKAIKPRIIESVVDALLEEFVEALQEYVTHYQAAGSSGSFEAYLCQQRSAVAESLLGVTDKRAQRSKNRTMVSAYHRLRPKGKVHVEQAVAGVGRVIDAYLPQSS